MLSTPPPYAAPTPREIVAFFAAISDGVDLPIMVYNWARGVGSRDHLADCDRTGEDRPRRCDQGQHDEPPSGTRDAREGRRPLRVFGGFIDRLGLAVLRGLGGDGNIDGGGLGAKFAVAFYEAFWRDDLGAAEQAANRYVALMTALIRPDWSGAFGSPQAQIKACMNMLGQSGGHVRPPLLPIDDRKHLDALRLILDAAGLS